jgi:putative SOS response-associated peptidase YedK
MRCSPSRRAPDVEPYQDRQVAIIRRPDVTAWLDHLEPEAALLAAQPKGTFWLEQIEGPPVKQGALGW